MLLTFTKDAVPPHANDTGLTVAIQPLDPKKSGAAAVGHPCRRQRVQGGDDLPALGRLRHRATKPGNVFIAYPTSSDRIEFSPDGKAWQEIKATRVGSNLQLGAEFTKPGYYEAAGPPTGSQDKKSGGGATTGLLIMGGIAVLIFSPSRCCSSAAGPGKGAAAKRQGQAEKGRR